MTNRTRRRLLQAAGASFVGWPAAWAQTPGRTLSVAPKPTSPGVMSASGELLIAPRRALVIGNSKYAVGPLRNPANDAAAIAEELRGQGFEVTLGLDLKRDEMAQLVGAYGQALARTKPVAVFYFAGHGLQLQWRNYLVPVDAALKSAADVPTQCIDVNAVIAGIGKAANPMNVIILDACRDDPFGKSEQKGLSQLDAPPGTLLAYATSPGNVASDGAGANGLYTEHLLREMKVPEAKIEDVFKRVRLAVRRRSSGQQIPWESTSLEEDFWFIPPAQLVRLAQEDAERQRRLQAAAEVERQRLEAAENERLAQLEKAREEAAQREFLEELALWEKTDGASEPGPLEDYLRRYPSGRFAELAQLQLDELLGRAGEKPIQIASQAGNPYTQGSARADIEYKVGNSYTYIRLNRVTKEERTYTTRVTAVTGKEVIFGNGAFVLDRLGNIVKLDGRHYSPRQDEPLEYAVGKKWPSRYAVKNERTGVGSESEMHHRITGRERITVPAGTFDCYVIESEGWSTSEKGTIVRLGWKRWMAPDKVRRAVAWETFRRIEGRAVQIGRNWRKRSAKGGKVVQNDRVELVAFSQS